MGFAAWVMRFVGPLFLFTIAFADTSSPGSDVVLGTMKGLVDGYVEKYTGEEADFKETSEAMQSVIDKAADAEAKERAIDEKAKMKKAHEEKLKELAGFIRTMDDTVTALKDKDWKNEFPELKEQVSKIFTAYPALISRGLLVRHAAARVSAIPSGSKSDTIVGTMKGLVDGYVTKYTEEEASFKESSEAMQSVIDKSADAESKERAIDEKAKMKKSNQGKLKDIAGFIRTLDDTVKALRPGDDSDWKDGFPDLKAQISKIYTAYPAFVQQPQSMRKRMQGKIGSSM